MFSFLSLFYKNFISFCSKPYAIYYLIAVVNIISTKTILSFFFNKLGIVFIIILVWPTIFIISAYIRWHFYSKENDKFIDLGFKIRFIFTILFSILLVCCKEYNLVVLLLSSFLLETEFSVLFVKTYQGYMLDIFSTDNIQMQLRARGSLEEDMRERPEIYQADQLRYETGDSDHISKEIKYNEDGTSVFYAGRNYDEARRNFTSHFDLIRFFNNDDRRYRISPESTLAPIISEAKENPYSNKLRCCFADNTINLPTVYTDRHTFNNTVYGILGWCEAILEQHRVNTTDVKTEMFTHGFALTCEYGNISIKPKRSIPISTISPIVERLRQDQNSLDPLNLVYTNLIGFKRNIMEATYPNGSPVDPNLAVILKIDRLIFKTTKFNEIAGDAWTRDIPRRFRSGI